ncbi:VanZ family protein [Arthrobacter gandavensis]|uniref:VanZ family protein n=1 Tax=Arthrobacter gandavensis TaxID=169960 RepID=UPI00188FF301|nr:VanZ family protein [Arthrobacter gandavensis]MBF4993001.1 VanZ family protein [Arthrobacter gandavensis]
MKMQEGPTGHKPRHRTLLALGLAAYAALLACIVFWPRPVDRGLSGYLDQVLRLLHSFGAPAWVDYTLVEAAANVLLFFPAGLLLAAWLNPRWCWLAAVVGLCVSAGIEATQALLLPERYATPHDVVANGLGAALGTLAVYAWHSRSPTGRPQTRTHPD